MVVPATMSLRTAALLCERLQCQDMLLLRTKALDAVTPCVSDIVRRTNIIDDQVCLWRDRLFPRHLTRDPGLVTVCWHATGIFAHPTCVPKLAAVHVASIDQSIARHVRDDAEPECGGFGYAVIWHQQSSWW